MIAFINSSNDVKLLNSVCNSVNMVFVRLENLDKLYGKKLKNYKIWLDLGFDAFGSPAEINSDSTFYSYYYDNFKSHYDKFYNSSFLLSPTEKDVRGFVESIYDVVEDYNIDYISIPQLPQGSNNGYAKINKMLAKVFSDVFQELGAKFVLPVIITKFDQIENKTKRTQRIRTIKTIVSNTQVDSLWVVDSSLDDQKCIQNFDKERFPSIINFHEEIEDKISPREMFAGPYWGLNLLLWCKGLISQPIAGLGSGYQYRSPGGIPYPAKHRIALKCLKRWVIVSPLFKKWLKDQSAIKQLPKDVKAELKSVFKKHLTYSADKYSCKMQIASYYDNWYDELLNCSENGRSVALFQQFSSSFVVGKVMSPLPVEMGSSFARRPEKFAEQLMLNCL